MSALKGAFAQCLISLVQNVCIDFIQSSSKVSEWQGTLMGSVPCSLGVSC